MLTGCSGLQGTGDKGYITGTGTVSQFPDGERGEPISLRGEDLDGAALSLDELRGAPVVVVVWGSWCTPCRAEAPDVIAAADRLRGEAAFVGINIRNPSVAESQAFVRRVGVPYPSFFSPGGEALLPFAGTLTLYTIPGFVVLDAEGRIAASIIGRLPSTTTLVDLVEDVEADAQAGAGSRG
ncbi:MAG: TlpA disulfide reductase family protein [Nocardioides sp.]